MRSFLDYYNEMQQPGQMQQPNQPNPGQNQGQTQGQTTPPGGNVAAPIPPNDPAVSQLQRILQQQSGTISRIKDPQIAKAFQQLNQALYPQPNQQQQKQPTMPAQPSQQDQQKQGAMGVHQPIAAPASVSS